MYKIVNKNPDIYSIEVPLPNNPLKYLNSYVIKTEEKNLIIDTGFNLEECHKALQASLDELQIDIDKTEIVLTHLHSDHTGLVSSIIKEDTTVYMSPEDYEYIRIMIEDNWRKSTVEYIKEGFTQQELDDLAYVNPAKVYNPSWLFKFIPIKDKQKINIGPYELTCLHTKGHTPGHMCLYMEKEEILFSSDHILFDITPNITRWPTVKDSLNEYLNSLNKIKELEIKLTLPAHRKNDMDVYERIDQLIHHHHLRLQEILEVVQAKPGLNAYEIAGFLTWSMKGKKWNDAPIQQKWFAVGEALSHLDYLEIKNKVYKKEENNHNIYFLVN